MDVTLTMTEREFLDFVQWSQDRNKYNAEKAGLTGKLNRFSQEVLWAIGGDPKYPDQIKIIDQKQAAKLLELAEDYFS